MRKQYKISLIIMGLILLLVALTTVIACIIPTKISTQNLSELTKKALNKDNSVLVGNISQKATHTSNAYNYEISESVLNKVRIPKGLFCIDHGQHFEYKSKTVQEVLDLDEKVTIEVGIPKAGEKCKVLPPSKIYSNVYYECTDTENHIALEPYAAYIVTQPTIYAQIDGKYKWFDESATYKEKDDITEEIKQMALWYSPINKGRHPEDPEGAPEFTYKNIAKNLQQESDEYNNYKEILDNTEKPITNETNIDLVNVNVNSSKQYMIVGPFKLNYVDGKTDRVAFSGISNITIKGYNDKDKNALIRNVEIISYIQNGEEKTLTYFNPSESEGYIDRIKQLGSDEAKKTLSYPTSGQEFYLKIKNPNQNITEAKNKVNYIDIEAEYKYMTSSGTKCELQAMQAYAEAKVRETYHGHYMGACSRTAEYTWSAKRVISENQEMISAWGERNLYKEVVKLSNGGTIIPTTMNLGGYVWEDVPENKENMANGIKDNTDRVMPNVKVTLYECLLDANGNIQKDSNGQIIRHVADLLSDTERKSTLEEEEKLRRVNPQLTDGNGYYQFNGLDASNKYYVSFEYNGQIYLPTEYLYNKTNGEETQYNTVNQMVNANLYNTDIWRITSKGTEADNDRYGTNGNNGYDAKFGEIGSSPLNYVSSNSLEKLEPVSGKEGTQYYNKTYSQDDLMGFVLNEKGQYSKSGIALIDGFYKVEDNSIVETNTLQQGIISEKINAHIKEHKEYPNMLNIYQEIVNQYGRNSSEKDEIWRKLQFIEDCKMKAYTGSALGKDTKGTVDLYPVYDDFVIDNKIMTIPGVNNPNKPPIYDGQYYVNLGLWRRQEVNLGLRKDILYAATRINGKTELYEYNKRGKITEGQKAELKELYTKYEANRTEENYYNYLIRKQEIEEEANLDYWEIQLRMTDYVNYYSLNYNRELYPADYNYKGSNTNGGEDLELYITYKITVRNTSQSILSEITEVVDYYDKDYTYIDNLSWIMYKDNVDSDNKQLIVSKDDYHDTIDELKLQGNIEANGRDVNASYVKNGNGNGDSIYGDNSKHIYENNSKQQDLEDEYNSVYIRGLDNKKLASGEEAYIYLTFKVKSDDNGPVILDDENSMKQNYAEINGYKTYYRDGTQLPNDVVKSSNNLAGLIDIDSNPGNLCLDDINNKVDGRYEQNFEDDTDRAMSIKVVIDGDAIRSINGSVWEDERTSTISNSVIGNGLRDLDKKGKDKEIGIKGVTVELVEKLADDKEYVWYTTTTDENGKYEFRNKKNNDKDEPYIVPGEYIIRFKYGNTEATVVPDDRNGNVVSYNGQDFKSTVYQKHINEKGQGKEEISGYNDKYYDIQEADNYNANGIMLSDAKDVWSRREAVNKYSSSNVTNHVAEVLASPYTNNKQLIDELIKNTNMTAETGIIVLEGEYNRQGTDGYNSESNDTAYSKYYGNTNNGKYTLNNVDLGLTERPKAQLELDKKVTNVNITLANGNNLFDKNEGDIDLIWKEGSEYKLDDKISKGKYEEYYNENHRYAYRTKVNELVNGKFSGTGDNGLISATMDEELMHGATITITYELKIKNIGETDYTGKDFYYKGTKADTKVTTSASVVLDYVANNLQFRANDNEGWKVATNITAGETSVNSGLTDAIKKYNTTITTNGLNKALKPGETTTKGLVLTQLITPENKEDDMAYNNIAEIVSISNTAGRRMAYSVQGNQDPTANPAEVDSAKSERVVILPPFGMENIVIYITIAIAALVILTGGIIFIKKKVLNK